MNKSIETFFDIYFARDLYTGFAKNTPIEMVAGPVDESGWYKWKPIKGTLTIDDYQKLQNEFNVTFPKSFIEWHKAYFFMRCEFEIVTLPHSSPISPLADLRDTLDYELAEEIIERKLYPFGSSGDVYLLVFDGREDVENNEFPIRVYDHDFHYTDLPEGGLGEIIFSSFTKLLECLTYFQKNVSLPLSEKLHEFFIIDPEGAGKTGRKYWMAWIS